MESSIIKGCRGLAGSLGLLACMCSTQSVMAWNGSTLQAGKSYYLYNLYQEKFLSYGNAWGTQVSLSNGNPVLCTIEASNGQYVINTHFSLTENGYSAGVNNYVVVVDGLPYVNSNYGTSDSDFTYRAPQLFDIAASDENGYYITFTENGVRKALMYDAGTACDVDALDEGFNKSKAEWLLIEADEYDEYCQKPRFTAAAMNVDGMPKTVKIAGVYTYTLNPDAKEADGATAIGQKLVNMGYDFIGVSEDFNYNSEIMAQIGDVYSQGTHRGGISVTASTYSKFLSQTTLFNTDGLNFFWNRGKTTATNEAWTAWNEHYGYTSDGADGLINKGYRYYTVTLADGVELDVYILHMDAETSSGDIAAREAQLTQLANVILASNNGRPIIVMGDTNCRYTRDRVKTLLIDAVNADERFTMKDAWVEHARNGIYPSCGSNTIGASEEGYRKGEVVDKIFYINNSESCIRIKAESYLQDLSFVNDGGEPLADHWPCVVEFSYEENNGGGDVTVENLNGEYYFRNKETGAFLKQGGWWGTHAVQGSYGAKMTLTELADGVYAIQSNVGTLTQGDPYMDGTAVTQWNVVKRGAYYAFTYSSNGTTMALSANDPTTFKYGPNTRYVTCAAYDENDDYELWEMVTAEELEGEMAFASADAPMNVTHLLQGANFDRNDTEGRSAWDNNISSSASKMWYNLCDGEVGFAFGNPVAEVYNDSYSGWTTYATTWEIGQTITDVPDGTYRVVCQGFYRDGDMNQNNPGSVHAYLYARTTTNEVSTPLASMYSANCTTSLGEGNTDNYGYFIPNSMSDATYFFNEGFYENSVEITVTGGVLQVAVGKPDVTKSTSGWTCFDNFQLYYLGADASAVAVRNGAATCINSVPACENVVYYNINGSRAKEGAKGVRIAKGKKVVNN